jgi:hypothetical protein
LHPAPTISSGAVLNTNTGGYIYTLGNSSNSPQTFAKGTSVTANLGFEVRNYDTDTVKSGATFTVLDVEVPSTFDSVSLTDAGVLTFQIKSSTASGFAGSPKFILRDAATNASRSYRLNIHC